MRFPGRLSGSTFLVFLPISERIKWVAGGSSLTFVIAQREPHWNCATQTCLFILSTNEYSSLLSGLRAIPGRKSGSQIQVESPGRYFSLVLCQCRASGSQKSRSLTNSKLHFPEIVKKVASSDEGHKRKHNNFDKQFFLQNVVHSVSEHIEWVAGGWSPTFV